ncbi:hypothetical protein HLH17_17745 [Acinetobacter sp. ANC 5380]|uniref:Transcriptional regulator n=1 Tax=Acinetobacter terrae TaxID=2731247 RepID=A0A7Y2S249_9GAMM|nr:hypothetical protein [Acinetobacter terrae]NNH17084.1 hypothetical protein [Acinetobacter terrae]NNH37513.1 hypothetical protein [Acinetobacter terrae]NNH79437.1 hypothetical protein [Acinetobacter terrae]NNH88704.1 hypothetical protein [Acinetobacter terrae]
MSNQQEKKLFAERLSKALTEAKHPISPTYLSNEFNHRYDGQPISVQSANNWLLGKAIPNQDKLAILALWLNVSNQWLRFGDVDQTNTLNINSSNSADLDFFFKFRRLNNSQKKIIISLINEFIE